MKWVEKFLKQETCPDCHASRLSEAARGPKLRGIPLDKACRMTRAELTDWVGTVPDSLPEEMRPMAHSICESFWMTAKRLIYQGLGYLTLDLASSTLSTGERQRMQLARAVRNRTTGVLYVLDEPSPSACIHWMCECFCGCFRHSSTIDSGATVVVIEHDLDIIRSADYIIDMGHGSGEVGGRIVATGMPEDVWCIAESVTGRFI